MVDIRDLRADLLPGLGGGRRALVLSKHPQLTPFQVKNVLYLTSANVRGVT